MLYTLYIIHVEYHAREIWNHFSWQLSLCEWRVTTILSVYRACPFFLINKTSIINDRINPFLSIAIGAPQSPRSWNETGTGEA